MDPNNPSLVGVIVVLSVTLVELVKSLISKRMGGGTRKSVEPACELSAKEHEALMAILALMGKMDNDGVPLVYTKRSYELIFESILEECRENANVQRTVLDLIRRIENRISLMPPSPTSGRNSR